MKIGLFILLLVTSVACFAQKRVVLTGDSVSVSYVIVEDSVSLSERVEIKNLSSRPIYIPDIGNRDLYFFIIDESLYSFFGIMNSILGAPNLSLDVRLIEISPDRKLELPLKVLKRSKRLSKFYFSFDYLKETDKIQRQNNILNISMEHYAASHKYVVNNIEGW